MKYRSKLRTLAHNAWTDYLNARHAYARGEVTLASLAEALQLADEAALRLYHLQRRCNNPKCAARAPIIAASQICQTCYDHDVELVRTDTKTTLISKVLKTLKTLLS
jgi:hypothetical protein